MIPDPESPGKIPTGSLNPFIPQKKKATEWGLGFPLSMASWNVIMDAPEWTASRERVRPFVFVGPALVIVGLYLVYPVFLTTVNAFKDARSENFVGLDNFIFIFTDSAMLIVLRNNLLWLVFVTFFVVAGGLVIAVMVDRIRLEAVAKSIIFLPMAISAVGASVIWKFVYSFQPAGRPQIGLLNAIWTAIGGEPQGWLIMMPWNTFFLIIIHLLCDRLAPRLFFSSRSSTSTHRHRRSHPVGD